jgi:hypothetical protein
LLASVSAAERDAILKDLNDAELEALSYDWQFWGRKNQLAPPGDWRVLAADGAGKTAYVGPPIIDRRIDCAEPSPSVLSRRMRSKRGSVRPGTEVQDVYMDTYGPTACVSLDPRHHPGNDFLVFCRQIFLPPGASRRRARVTYKHAPSLCLIFCTVPTPTPTSRAVLIMPVPLASSAQI